MKNSILVSLLLVSSAAFASPPPWMVIADGYGKSAKLEEARILAEQDCKWMQEAWAEECDRDAGRPKFEPCLSRNEMQNGGSWDVQAQGKVYCN